MIATSEQSHLVWLYRLLQHIRPVEVAVLLKKLLKIERREVRLENGFIFWLDPVSHLGFQLIACGEYEPELCALIGGVLRPKDFFVDVGANEGFFSLLAGNAVGPEGKVLAIEPQSRLNEVQMKNLSLNSVGNVRLCQLALSGKTGFMDLRLTSEINSGNSGFYAKSRWGSSTEKVAVTTLDQLLSDTGITQRIRLIKIDCEGAEGDVLTGAESTIENRRADFILVDFHEAITGNEVVRKIDGTLRKAGYLLSRLSNGLWVYHLPELEKEISGLSAVQLIPPL